MEARAASSNIFLRDGGLWVQTSTGEEQLKTGASDIESFLISPSGRYLAFLRRAGHVVSTEGCFSTTSFVIMDLREQKMVRETDVGSGKLERWVDDEVVLVMRSKKGEVASLHRYEWKNDRFIRSSQESSPR